MQRSAAGWVVDSSSWEISPFPTMERHIFPTSSCRAQRAPLSLQLGSGSAMELPMENLLVSESYADEQQEDGETHLRPPEHDDSQDEGDG